MYAQQVMPGNMSFRVTCHESLEWCTTSLERFATAVYTDDVTADLYPVTDEDWQLAREYETVGCPFDYPSKTIDRGARGALRITNA
jgi:hypothetical protein